MSSELDETGHSNYGILLNRLNPEQKALMRKLERVNRKLVNCSHAVMFNKTCINESLLPQFTDIYI